MSKETAYWCLLFCFNLIGCSSTALDDCKLNTNARACCNMAVLAECFEQCQQIAVEHCPEMYHHQFRHGNEPMGNQLPRPHVSIGVNTVTLSQKYKQFGMCGTKSSNYIPCVSHKKADLTFQRCCRQFVDKQCHDLCHFETHENKAHLAFRLALSKNCSLTNMAPIIYCASQNRDNTHCCNHLDYGSKTENQYCNRLCSPSKGQINVITKNDVVCLQNWHVLMYCHLSGLT